eukprot:3189133-Rhodomonas_salina.3
MFMNIHGSSPTKPRTKRIDIVDFALVMIAMWEALDLLVCSPLRSTWLFASWLLPVWQQRCLDQNS